MEIEAGKYYRTRDGQKVGPMRFDGGATRWVWDIDTHSRPDDVHPIAGGLLWDAGGICVGDAEHNLIAKWTDPAPEPTKPDLTAIKTPFGLLDAETQEALKAHGGPYQVWDPTYVHQWFILTETASWVDRLVYRVKPAPPKPREWWLRMDAVGGVCGSDPVLGAPPPNWDDARTIRVREVLE